MIRLRRHRLRLALRALLLALLVSCTIAQPVLAAWNEAHELAAHVVPGTDVPGDRHGNVHGNGRGNDSEDPAPHHELAQLHAQCCFQPQMPPPEGLALPPAVAISSGPHRAVRTWVPDPRLTSPFRPPIGI